MFKQLHSPLLADPPFMDATCKGSADCMTGSIASVIDGDTLDIRNTRIRLALVDTPEIDEGGYEEAKRFTSKLCPVDSQAVADEDDGQLEGSFGKNRRISRVLLMEELALGEGAIKTLVKHMKMDDLIVTSNGGTRLTPKGKAICKGLTSSIPTETTLPKCSIALGRFNHAVLLKDLSYVIKSGIEQRDAAIRMDATGATTLLYKDRKIVMPTNQNQDSLKKESAIRNLLIERLKPEQDDVIIIGSSDSSPRIAELAAKHAALSTLVSHEDHS